MRRPARVSTVAVLLALAAPAGSSARDATTNAPEAKTTAVKVEMIADGLQNPWGLQFLPDDRILVTERPGRMRIIDKAGTVSEPVDGLPQVVNGGQAGLLDVLVAPDFEKSGTIYFSYSEPRGSFRNATAVVRATLKFEGTSGRIENGTVIFRQDPAVTGFHHYGSRLVLAKDGTLFITLGERMSLREEAQNLENHLGKIVRINTDGSVPAGNPFNGKKNVRSEIWSYGHRNLQGAALHPETGKLWTIEHGAKGGDELNISEASKNYGWPVITWGVDYDGSKIGEGTAKDGLEQPVYYWVPSIATSGLTFYTGDLFPEWKGNLFVGGLRAAHIERLVLEGEQVVGVEKLLADIGSRIRDVRQGPDGALWVLTDNGRDRLLRIMPAK